MVFSTCDILSKNDIFHLKRLGVIAFQEKSCIRETKHLWTDAVSSTNNTVGRTKNNEKHIFFYGNIYQKRKNSKNI